MASEDGKEEAFNPRRRLCPDGGCIGIIGGDGKCTICGRTDSGSPAPSTEEQALAEDAHLPPEDDFGDDAASNEEEPGATFDPHRRLCSDDTCIGVIGSDDRCSVCGKPAKG